MSVQAKRAVSSSMNQFVLYIDVNIDVVVSILKLSMADLITVSILTAIAGSFVIRMRGRYIICT